jgi:hypothetical protein
MDQQEQVVVGMPQQATEVQKPYLSFPISLPHCPLREMLYCRQRTMRRY